MIKQLLAILGLLVAGAPVAHAQLSSTVTATSDYDFRGVSLSATDPALQASADYAFGGGFVASAWVSNVDFGDDADIEIDLTLAYSAPLTESMTWTAGIVSYNWPKSDLVGDYPEAFVGIGIGWLGLKQWFAHDYGDLGESAWYTEANATWPVTPKVSVLAHAGYSYGTIGLASVEATSSTTPSELAYRSASSISLRSTPGLLPTARSASGLTSSTTKAGL